ncbi:MAG: rod shape-determining protein MreC [Synechococcales bacterium]|nr:rod shape-determining protein MreC [Synechococcales bacterium]
MFTLRRWWDRYGLQLGLASLALAGAWTIRQTNGLPILEVYRLASSPFHAAPSREEILATAQFQELQHRLADLERQNQQLQEMLGQLPQQEQPVVTAPIIGRSADQWWQQITIGRGSEADIEVGDVVSGSGGLVGRITHVTPHTSRVLLISDPASQVGATISRSRTMGYLRGQAANQAVLVFFDKVPDVRPGDVVTTSSLSQLFPPGIPVGRIQSIDLKKTPAPEAVVELSAPISFLEWVFIHPHTSQASATDEN